ncbi:MAG: ATP-dependent DNA helicase RecG, partial [Lachnospiraceae bacterium]|nr:ATP-dependent DNA helicase RecG [Lachnospiraceae bacterium]
MNETSPITELKGIGEKTGKLFERVGVTKIGQLLSYFPRAYEKYDEIKRADALKDGTVAAVYGCFPAALAVKRIKNKQIVTGIFESNFQKIKVLWYNMPYLRSTLKA